ncbi:Translation initiation factor eIF-4E [uncultured virus]|nr:Translation initiation factor eIF-4E [uncultured virus]
MLAVIMGDITNTIEHVTDINAIPPATPLIDIMLPNEWVLYLYDKALFKKMTNRPNFQAKPHKEVCTITTVNDLMYILELLGIKNESKLRMDFVPNERINLDAHDYIIMRKGIEPIWEDPKNSNGGTFTIKMDHARGYDVWSHFVMCMLGETLTENMDSINGITVSYISDAYNFNSMANNKSYTYIKVWDAASDNTRDNFVNSLPADLLTKIKCESLKYTPNNEKKHYGQEDIITKLHSSRRNSYGQKRGGFSSYRGGRGDRSGRR